MGKYTISCRKGGPTPSNPCFINIGKGKRRIVGEITKVTRDNTIGFPEKRVEIVMTASGGYSQNDIIKSLKLGKHVKKNEEEKLKSMRGGY